MPAIVLERSTAGKVWSCMFKIKEVSTVLAMALTRLVSAAKLLMALISSGAGGENCCWVDWWLGSALGLEALSCS